MHRLTGACLTIAARFPHVAGVYTILAVVANQAAAVCDAAVAGAGAAGGDAAAAAGGAGDRRLDDDNDGSDDVASAAPDADAAAAWYLLEGFAGEVEARCRQYRGELLLAALQLLIALPRRAGGGTEDLLVTALETALRAGATNASLALLAIVGVHRLLAHGFAAVAASMTRLLPLVGDLLHALQERNDALAAAAGSGEDNDIGDGSGDGGGAAAARVGAGGAGGAVAAPVEG